MFENFDEHEIQVLGVTIQAYADNVGGAQQLKRLAQSKWRSIIVWKDAANAGADTTEFGDIRLGATTFNLALATNPQINYSSWGAANDDEYAQVVFGHEIGHNMIEILRPTKDWAEEYYNNVPRGDGNSWLNVKNDAEEEAVTNLALYVLQRGYRWSFYPGPGQQDTDQTRIGKIDDWAQDFLNALRNF